MLFGNAERSILELLARMEKTEIKNKKFEGAKEKLKLNSIEGVSFRIKKSEINPRIRKFPSYEECVDDKQKFNLLTRTFYLLPDDSRFLTMLWLKSKFFEFGCKCLVNGTS